jgi:phospholipase C
MIMSCSLVLFLSGCGSPAAPDPLSALSCTSAAMTGAGTDTCTVSLNAVAGSRGLSVSLFSNNAAVTLPATVTVPANTASITFSATVASAATAQTATLTATSGTVSEIFALELNAYTPTLKLSTGSLAFGSVPVNTAATPQSVTLTSSGTAPLTISTGTLTGAGFSMSGASFPLTLNQGKTATLKVSFDPSVASVFTGTLTLTSNSSSSPSAVISLSGTGAAVPGALSCTSASMTGSGTDACTVTLNTAAGSGGLSVNLFSSNAAVTLPASVTVPANATSAAFSATIASVTTAQAATLTATSGTVSKTFPLELNAYAPALSLSTGSLAFGSVTVNTAAAPQSVTLTSSGTAPLTISAGTPTGAGFSMSGMSFPLTLNQGQTATLIVSFDPAAIGAATGQLTLTSNSSTSPSTVISLSGTVTAPGTLSALSCTSASMTGSGTDFCTVSLNAGAGNGGLVVSLSSSNSAATLPATVTLPANTASAAFPAAIALVTTAQKATITARVDTASQTFAVELNPYSSRDNSTTSPIKHVIVIVGENRSFDHVFATYVPKNGETIWNLLSEGIVNADGTPGTNFSNAEQQAAADEAPDAFLLSPSKSNFPSSVLPAPLVGGPEDSYIPDDSLTVAQQSENGLPAGYYGFLVTGGTGQTSATPDQRITNVSSLPAGPFQLTNGVTFTYNDYAASPVHRFYQMWQQLDCDVSHATQDNPSGCDGKLFPWVETTIGTGDNGLPPPADFSPEYSPNATTTGEGSSAMGFYNVQKGDAPYFKSLADEYSMSDNFHQAVNGGTGANHIMLGHADMIWFSDGQGNPAAPPHNTTPDQLDEVENPNPQSGTNNWYAEDGYGGGPVGSPANGGGADGGGGAVGSPAYGGGSYTNCSDNTQPGVAPIIQYLQSLSPQIDPNCEAGHYYLLNNYNPGYFGNGNNAFTDTNADNTVFTIPPSSTPSIGDELIEQDISWKYYGDQWDNYVPDPYQLNYGAIGTKSDEYCDICNPFQYDTSIMANAALRTSHIQDTANLYDDIQNGALPAVSIVKPSGLVDGHPASSKLELFEGFSKKIVDLVKANSELWADTAIFITFDEGGGYYDSGYVQPVDFFGDGPRIPLLVVSKYSQGGKIGHEYSDHVSILKFIERNWGTDTITSRSRDNFPNPITSAGNPYVPVNSPAIGDLFSMFRF